MISRQCCWGVLQCLSWNQFAMRSTWLQVAVPRADGYSLRNNYPSMYRFSCAIGCNCFCAFNLSSCFIPYIISGIRRCSYVVSFISSHLLFNCDWSDSNSSIATHISIQDYSYLQHGFAWLIAVVMNSFQAASQISLIFICIPFWIGFGPITFRRYACTAVNIDDLTSQTTSNNKDSANVEISMRGCYAWR